MWPFEEETRAIKSGIAIACLIMLPFLLLFRLLGFVFATAVQEREFQKDAGRWNFPPPPPRPDDQQKRKSFSASAPKSDPFSKHRSNLGVEKGASKDEIKKKYRTLSKAVHPDKVPESQKPKAEEDFKKLNEAYNVLMNERETRNQDSAIKPKYWG